ncbi:MAG: hypothetical protein GY854_26340, partial [Deltaproteobacteria bacterium]|nr:hypothetical protein [Deltaproteobacteria bacterium]
MRCTSEEEIFFLGQHTWDENPDPLITECSPRIGDGYGDWSAFIDGTDLGYSVYNEHLGIYHFYMGDTWGPGSASAACHGPSIGGATFTCESNGTPLGTDVSRGDVLGWIMEDEFTSNPEIDGVTIQLRKRPGFGFGTRMNGFGIKGIHNNLQYNSILQNYWISIPGKASWDWRFSTPAGSTYVRENVNADKFEDEYTYLMWYVTAGFPRHVELYDVNEYGCPYKPELRPAWDPCGELDDDYKWKATYTPHSWLTFKKVIGSDLVNTSPITPANNPAVPLLFPETMYYNDPDNGGEKTYRVFSADGWDWEQGKCGEEGKLSENGLAKFLGNSLVYVSPDDFEDMCTNPGYDTGSIMCDFKEDGEPNFRGGWLIYGSGRPAGRTPLYLAYI